MKKIVLSLLAVVCGGVAASQAAEPATSTAAERNAALFASGATVQVSQYYYSGRRYYHRQFTGYRTQKVVYWRNGVKYVRYDKVAVYRYW
jgi:hypothetical protein